MKHLFEVRLHVAQFDTPAEQVAQVEDVSNKNPELHWVQVVAPEHTAQLLIAEEQVRQEVEETR